VDAVVAGDALFYQLFEIADVYERNDGAVEVWLEEVTGVEYGAYPIDFLEVALVVAANDESVSVRFKRGFSGVVSFI